MKKIILIVLFAVLSMNAMAKIKVTSGSADCMRENAIAVVVFDYSEATYDMDQSYEKWCGEDFVERAEKSASEFIKAFNKESKGLKISQQSNEAKYRITFKVGNCDQYTGMNCNWGQMRFKCSGIISVTEISTGKEVCVLTVDKEKSDCDYTPLDRIAECFAEVGKFLARQ